jgi:hypothetical protein
LFCWRSTWCSPYALFESQTLPAIEQLAGLAYVARLAGYPGEHVYIFLVEENNR